MFMIRHSDKYWMFGPRAGWTSDTKEARKYDRISSAEGGRIAILRFHPEIDPLNIRVEEVPEDDHAKG